MKESYRKEWKPDWRSDCKICTAGCIGARIERSHPGGYISQKPTGGNGRLALRRWKTRLSKGPW
jgi:hypothetical protein